MKKFGLISNGIEGQLVITMAVHVTGKNIIYGGLSGGRKRSLQKVMRNRIVDDFEYNFLGIKATITKMKVLYTARAKFGKSSDSDTMAWEKYLEWSRLPQLIELISVDGMLNERLIEPDRDDEKEWDYIVIDNMYETGFFTTLDYVLKKIVEKEKYNLLAVIINPDTDCRFIEIENFEFIGYDLLDKYYDISALSNCGGFDETFRPEELNQFGLVEDFNRAMEIKGNLLLNNPEEVHADTNAIAIWRHKYLGR